MSILNSSIVPASAGGDEIDNSLRFNRDDSAYLSRTPSSAGNRKTWTWSGWVKRGTTSSEVALFSVLDGASEDAICFRSDGKFNIQTNTGSNTLLRSNALYRDPSAWYHLVAVMDTTQATASDRAKMYVNGVQITDLQLNTYPAQNSESAINTTNAHKHGADLYGTYFDGYLAEVNFIDGQALDPSSFGEVDEDYGHWKPKKASDLTYGNNGFYLDFADSAAFGNDVSGNNNDFTNNNLAATDQMLDTPTNNFCTLNPLHKMANSYSSGTVSEGNLKVHQASPDAENQCTFAVSTGKWYWETYTAVSGNSCTITLFDLIDHTGGSGAANRSYINVGGGTPTVYVAGTESFGGTSTPSHSATDVLSVALDLDNGAVYSAINGVWSNSGDPTSGSSKTGATVTSSVHTGLASATGEWTPGYTDGSGGDYGNIFNFGQDSSFAGNKTAQGNSDGNGYGDFYYTPPTGFNALCTQNLPDPDVIPSEHFNTVTYSGDDVTAASGGQAISDVGFQPDMTWIKSRNSTHYHSIHDAVRGVGTGTNETLYTNSTEAEPTAGEIHIKSFDADGVTVAKGDSGSTNGSGYNYVAWNWKANGSGSSNTDGTINTTSTSANVDAGFSISTYTGNGTTGATVGHGLSSAPEMVIVKHRNSSSYSDWTIYHASNTDEPETEFIQLNTTDGTSDDNERWNDTAPTADVFSVGDRGEVNGNTETYVAYCFHSVEGYSKVGSYTGNGSTDGTFVYTGFRPAFIMTKCSSSTGVWMIHDTARNPSNLATQHLRPNNSTAEDPGANEAFDLNSNGFKARGVAVNNSNGSGQTYIYLAFAEHPFKYSNAR